VVTVPYLPRIVEINSGSSLCPTTQGSEIRVPLRALEAENDLKKNCW